MTNRTPIAALAKRLLREESGATAVEYGVMIAAIAAVIILTVASVGGKLNGKFSYVDTEMDALQP